MVKYSETKNRWETHGDNSKERAKLIEVSSSLVDSKEDVVNPTLGEGAPQQGKNNKGLCASGWSFLLEW